jgi:putative glycosyltransferase (TIGR04372 family)
VKFALNINDKRYIDYSKSNSFSLEKELTLINQSKLYIGSCTGLDVIALTNEIDTLLINVTLGTSFQTTYLTKKTIFVPAKLYSTTYDRYLTLTEYLEYLNLLELEYKIDRFENYHQSQFGVIQIHPSEDEILESVKESLNLIDNIDFMTDDDNINQDKFWNIYPKEFPINEIKLSRKAHKTPHLAIISPYFLKKNPFFLALIY